VDRTNRKVKLSLRGKEVMEELIKKERDHTARSEGCNWHPEFGSWMVESTPSRPYTG
jgi:glutamate--cysteine ligase catalytic subunit